MVLVIITIAIIIGIIVLNIYWYKENWFYGFLDFLFSLFIGFVVWGIFGLQYLATGEVIEEKSTGKQNIYSIRDDSSIEGSFGGGIFLVRGSIEEVDYYYYWIKTKDGMHRSKKAANNSYIVEEDIEQPYVETFEPICKFIDGEEGECLDEDNKYVFHIPKGSIKYNYNLK